MSDTESLYQADLYKWMNSDEVPATVYLRMVEHAKEMQNKIGKLMDDLDAYRLIADTAIARRDLVIQDIDCIRTMIEKGSTTDDIMKFLNTPNA